MSTIKVGNFEMTIWKDGHPVWCFLKYGGKEINHIDHRDLEDLEYMVKKARKAVRDALPDNYKEEA